MKMTPFWYRRVCEIAILLSLIVAALYGAGLLMGGAEFSEGLFVPLPAAVIAGVTALYGVVVYFWMPRQHLWWAALSVYLLLAATVGTLVVMTGFTSSPFIAFWLVIAVFAGMFGYTGLGTIFALTNGYLLYHFLTVGTVGKSQLLVFFLAAELPLIVSYLIWHTKHKHDNEKDQAFDALARELHQVSSKSDIVINAIADGVLVIDARGTIQLFNPAAQTIVGWDKQEAQGLDYRSVFKLSDNKGNEIQADQDPIQQVIKGGKSQVNNELTLTTPAGKKILLSLLVSPMSNTPGSGVIAVFRDITAQKQEERAQAEFISTASHEMRTPVAAIEGYLGLALNPATAQIDDKARSFLVKAHEATQHLGRLFQDLLDVSRAEDGRLTSDPSVTDVVAFVGGVVEGLDPKAREKGLTMLYKPDQNSSKDSTRRITPVYYSKVDNDHLNEIVANLVENAIKYTQRGSITVDVTGDDSSVSVSVHDTGFGIPKEDIPHLFQKFYRVDNSDTREIGGTGLGLYLCRRLAEAMGGTITVESEYGHGSTFTLKLPRLDSETAVDELEQTAEQAPATESTAPAISDVTAAPSQTLQPPTPQPMTAPVGAEPAALATPPSAAIPTPVSAPTPTPAPVAAMQAIPQTTAPANDPMLRATTLPQRSAQPVNVPSRVTLDVLERQVAPGRGVNQ